MKEQAKSTLEKLAKEIFLSAPSIQSFGFDKTLLIYEINDLTAPTFIFCAEINEKLKGWLVENEISHQDVLTLYPYINKFPFETFTVSRKNGVVFY